MQIVTLTDFKQAVAGFTVAGAPIRKSLSDKTQIGLNFSASSQIRKPYTLQRCREIIKSFNLPYAVIDCENSNFQIINLQHD